MKWSYTELFEKGVQRVKDAGAESTLNLSCETQSTTRINREYTDSLLFEPRFMGSVWADTHYNLFGKDLPSPIIASPTCNGRMLGSITTYDNHYLDEFAAGLAAANTIMCLGMVSPPPFVQNIIDQGVSFIQFVKPYASSREETKYITYLLQDAEDRGALAVGLDIDVFFGEKTRDENPRRYPFGPQSMKQLEIYKKATDLPFIIKGILSVHDALKAREIGADAIIVSNHGGEHIDYAIPVLKVLPEIRKALPDMTILVDSGFGRGSDILKALALGADCVGVLSILQIAFAAYGGQGVTRMMEILTEELQRNMSITGCRDVKSIDSSIIRTL